MCAMSTCETSKRASHFSVRSGVVRLIPDGPTTDVLKYICTNIYFLESWLKPL